MLYVFTDCKLDTERYRLYRDGCHIPLRPTTFQLLTYLVEHRDRMVSKRELGEQVWQAHVVSNATLENCMKTVRQAIGDSGRTQQIIRTWYGHGYRFVAPVEVRWPFQWHAAAVAPPATAPILRHGAQAPHNSAPHG